MKKCNKCGKEFADDSAFCTDCGISLVDVNADADEKVEITQSSDSSTISEQPQSSTGKKFSIEAHIGPSVEHKAEVPVNRKMIIIIVVAAVCLIIGIAGIIFGIVQANSHSNNSNGNGGASTSGDSTPATIVSTEPSITKTTLGKWEVSIPDDYEFEVDGSGYLNIYENSNNLKWVMSLTYLDSTLFSKLESGWSNVSSTLASYGVTNVKENKTTINGSKFYYATGVLKGDNVIYSYTPSPDLYTFCAEAYYTDDIDGKELLEIAAKILSTAKAKTSSRDLSVEGDSITKNKPLNLEF